MLGLILSLVGGLGGLGVIGACVFIPGASEVIMGVLRSIGAVLAKIPPWAYAALAVVGLIAFLYISRGHWMDRAHKDEAQIATICSSVRIASGNPKLDCSKASAQILLLGQALATSEANEAKLRGEVADTNGRITQQSQQLAAEQQQLSQARQKGAQSIAGAKAAGQRLAASSRQKPPPSEACGPIGAEKDKWS